MTLANTEATAEILARIRVAKMGKTHHATYREAIGIRESQSVQYWVSSCRQQPSLVLDILSKCMDGSLFGS